MKNPTALAFVMTDKCSAACRICCYSCSPKGKMLLDEARIKEYIDQAAEAGHFKVVAFTGGEVIMHFRQFKSCVSYANKYGFTTTVVTNGFWAKNPDKGYKLMKELADAGLNQVSMSIDKFHQEFVPLETQKNAMRILKTLGMMANISFMENKDGSSIGSLWEDLRPEIYGVNIVDYPMLPVGEARVNLSEDQYIRLMKSETTVCPQEDDIVVYYDGTIIPCCTQFSYKIPFLNFGNYKTMTLAEAVTARKHNDFWYVLLAKGFVWFLEQAKDLGYEFPEYYTIPCELCYDLFTDAELCEKLMPRVEAEAGRMRLAKLFGR
jgi:hypothetical protein